MNKQDFVLKTVMLIVAIGFIVGAWFSFNTIDKQASEIEKLEKEVKRKENEVNFLKNDNKQKTQVFQESENKKVDESINVFLESVFNVDESNLEERRSNAKTVLTQDMFKKLFPAEQKTEKLLYEHDLTDVNIYTNVENQNASAYVTFLQTAENLANNKKNQSRLTLEVFLQKEGEEWIVNEFQQINSEPL